MLLQWLQHGLGSTLANINHLIETGANPNARNSFGQTCLHLLIKSAGFPFQPEELRRVLAQLIKHGADVNATDHNGNSVTDISFHQPDLPTTAGSYPADLWACSLAACGYDVFVDFQNSQPRLPRFDSWYHSDHFETLWDGVGDRSYILTNIIHSSKDALSDIFSTLARIFQPGDLARLLEIEPCLLEGMDRYQWAFDLQQAEISLETIQNMLASDGSQHRGHLFCTTPGDPRKSHEVQDTVYRRPNPGFHHVSCCHHETLQRLPSDSEAWSDHSDQLSQSSMARLMEPLARQLFGPESIPTSAGPPYIYFFDDSTYGPETEIVGTDLPIFELVRIYLQASLTDSGF